MISASNLSRAMRCPGSVSLPSIERTSENAQWGRMVHRYLELISEGKHKDAENELPPDVIRFGEAIDLDWLPVLSTLSAEAAYAYDAAEHRARFLGAGIDRNYRAHNLATFEIPGTADLAGVTEDTFYVWDFKLGRAEPAFENVQLKLLALAGCLAHGKGKARGSIVYIREGHTWVDSAEWELMDLEAFGAHVLGVIQAKPDATLAEGPWCNFCPAFAQCPAKKTLAMELAGGDLNGTKTKGLSRDNAGAVWAKIRLAKDMLKKLEGHIIMMAQEEPIQLPGGKMLGMVVGEGNEKLDGDIAYQVVRALLNDEAANEAVERKATKVGIKQALKKYKETVPNAPTEVKILNEIRIRGGATKPVSRKVEEY